MDFGNNTLTRSNTSFAQRETTYWQRAPQKFHTKGNNILTRTTTEVSYKGKQHFDKEHHRSFVQRETTFWQGAPQKIRTTGNNISTRSTTEVSYKEEQHIDDEHHRSVYIAKYGKILCWAFYMSGKKCFMFTLSLSVCSPITGAKASLNNSALKTFTRNNRAI